MMGKVELRYHIYGFQEQKLEFSDPIAIGSSCVSDLYVGRDGRDGRDKERMS